MRARCAREKPLNQVSRIEAPGDRQAKLSAIRRLTRQTECVCPERGSSFSPSRQDHLRLLLVLTLQGGATMTTQTADHEKSLSLLRNPSLWPGTRTRELLGNLSYYSMLLGDSYSDDFLEEIRPYYWYVAERTTVKERLDLLLQLAELAERRVTGLGCLQPFLSADEDPAVISTASLNLAVLIPLVDGDPLTGPREVLRFTEGADTDATYAGILQGILLLGDRRILPLLDRCWEPLGPEGRRILLHSWSGFVYASTIDFLLSWLESATAESEYGSIAGVLASYPLRKDAFPFVADVERKFPANGPGKGPCVRQLGRWTFEEYGKIIAPRVKAIAAAETGERVIPKVLGAWRIS